MFQCRRCPDAYHLGCMPRAILDAEETRIWIPKKPEGEGEHLQVEDSNAILC